MSGFTYDGAIVKIRVENFMTYDEVVMVPGPNLNMILGPNGTGKSAMVCCIIIGLAGEVSLTGRGASPVDFVKKNREYAVTQIELHNNKGPNHIVERRIILDKSKPPKVDHKSEWKINNITCLKIRVQELMKELNIKVDNLCQFLPQDSVTQFVKMNTVELLEDTLKAAGDNQLVEDHKTLVDKTKDINEAKNNLEKLKQSREENEVNVQRLESEVQHLQQREKLLKQRKLCNQKIYYARYMETKAKLDIAKIEGRRIADELKKVENNCEPFRKAKDQFANEETKCEESIRKSTNNLNRSLDILQQEQTTYEDLKLKCVEEDQKFRTKESEENVRLADIRLKELELQNLQEKLCEARDIDCNEQIKAFQVELENYKVTVHHENRKFHQNEDLLKDIVRKLEDAKQTQNSIANIKDRKIQYLRTRYPDAYTIVDWLSKNRDRFSGHVHLPLMCEINVKHPEYSKYVENAISKNDFQAFLCESKEDVTTLSRVAREELRVKINVILAPEKSRDLEFSQHASQLPNLAQYGLKYYLKDVIDAPDAIVRYLCANSNFHRTPISENVPETKIQRLLESKYFPIFYCNGSIYTVTRSRYDNATILAKDSVREPTHLKYSLDTEQLEEVKETIRKLLEKQKELHLERSQCQTELDKYKRLYHEASIKLKSLHDKQGEKRRIEQRISRISGDLDNRRAEKIDLEAERLKLDGQIKRISKKMVLSTSHLVDICQEFVQVRRNHMKNLISKDLAGANRNIAEKNLRVAESEAKRLKEEYEKFENSLETYRRAIEEAKRDAEEHISGFKKGKLDSKTTKSFEEIEFNDVDSLKSLKNDLTAQIERIQPDRSDILTEFRQQQQDLRNKKDEIEALEAKIKDVERHRDQIKNNWRSKLEDVIKVIDSNYRSFMRKLNYGGQVKLDYDHNDVNNFAAYGISIMVKYRDEEELIPLTSTRQSGGERSVATMIYMLALQTKTTVPFRCVDEINQGMDKENERKVFELLVDTADSSSSQYFLVSPKLLSNLAYSEKMKIHIVFNGKRLKTPLGNQSNQCDEHRPRKTSTIHKKARLM